MVDKKAAEDAKNSEIQTKSELNHLKEELSFIQQKYTLIQSQFKEATELELGEASEKPSANIIFQKLLKALERGKKAFTLLDGRIRAIENSQAGQASKEPIVKVSSEPIGQKRQRSAEE